ncbi:MAG: peptidase M48, partial [Brevundimonas sp.]
MPARHAMRVQGVAAALLLSLLAACATRPPVVAPSPTAPEPSVTAPPPGG